MLLAVLMFSGFLLGNRFYFQDFSIYWRSAGQFLQGETPYLALAVSSFVRGHWGLVDSDSILSVWSPPTFLGPMVPFALLSIDSAKGVYLAVMVLAFCGWIVMGVGQSQVRSRLPVVLLLTFPWFSWYDALMWGGVGVIGAAGLLLLMRLKRDHSVALWSFALLPLALKPHCTLPLLAVFFLLSDQCIRRRLLSGVAIVAIALSLPIFCNPTVVSQYFALELSTPLRYQRYNTTFIGALNLLGIEGRIAQGLAIVALVFALGVVWRKRGKFNTRLAPANTVFLLSPLLLFLSPYAWNHDYTLCSGWFAFQVGFQKREVRKRGALLLLLPLISLNLLPFTAAATTPFFYILGALGWAIAVVINGKRLLEVSIEESVDNDRINASKAG